MSPDSIRELALRLAIDATTRSSAAAIYDNYSAAAIVEMAATFETFLRGEKGEQFVARAGGYATIGKVSG